MNWNSLQNSAYSFFGIWYFFPFLEFLFACVFKSSAAVSKVFLMANVFFLSHFFEPNSSMLISSGPKYLETKWMDSIGTKTLLLFLYSISKHSLLVLLVLIFFRPLKIPIPWNK